MLFHALAAVGFVASLLRVSGCRNRGLCLLGKLSAVFPSAPGKRVNRLGQLNGFGGIKGVM